MHPVPVNGGEQTRERSSPHRRRGKERRVGTRFRRPSDEPLRWAESSSRGFVLPTLRARRNRNVGTGSRQPKPWTRDWVSGGRYRLVGRPYRTARRVLSLVLTRAMPGSVQACTGRTRLSGGAAATATPPLVAGSLPHNPTDVRGSRNLRPERVNLRALRKEEPRRPTPRRGSWEVEEKLHRLQVTTLRGCGSDGANEGSA